MKYVKLVNSLVLAFSLLIGMADHGMLGSHVDPDRLPPTGGGGCAIPPTGGGGGGGVGC